MRAGIGVAIGVGISATNESKRSMPPLRIHHDRSEPRGRDYTHDYNNHSTACRSWFLTTRNQWEDALKWWLMDRWRDKAYVRKLLRLAKAAADCNM